ncbi:uncharacterized protein LOC123538636 [Mercenaria mercenaria]|uniref:uncharacterized protein LOC123538636 n=1 Tax=Mercenaria mercenaria TaxID=6596 RepID=UPI00234F1D9F|nr:uncharacterized protein LOC123538636 [Mercenaria mercenaria]
MMQLIKLNVCILFLLVSSVSSKPTEGWREISVLAKSAIWAASRTADHLGVKYKSMLKAYENINTDIDTTFYWVFFIAECVEGKLQECQGKYLSSREGEKIINASCGPLA